MTEEAKPNNDEPQKTKGTGETVTEQFEIAGNQLVERVKDLVAQGNVRRIIFRTPDDTVMMDVNLTTGALVGGAVAIAAPWLAAIGALAALVARVRIEVVREVKTPDVVEGKVSPIEAEDASSSTTGKQKVRVEIDESE